MAKRGKARTFGQDLMRGEHTVGEKPAPAAQHVKGVLMTSDSGNDPAYYAKKQAAEKRLGRTLTTEEFQRDHYEGPESYQSGTSIFDPVLCELAYRWFCPPGGLVLDPFAGGSVRGIVAAKLGRRYVGIELRAEQVEANRKQARAICGPGDPMPVWIVGDSVNLLDLLAEAGITGGADFVFSCPPYADLEVYSDDPRDLSTLAYPQFKDSYARIIAQAMRALKADRFAAFVVGDVRDKQGRYHGFPWHTIEAFQQTGAALYNEAVLVTAVGSLPVRVRRQFEAGRKLGKTHQNVLTFVKGDPRQATVAIGPVEFGEPVDGVSEPAQAAP
jgi:hypothetical protein